jgi:hypothetical protein
MLSMLAKSTGLLALASAASYICPSCSADPTAELTEWFAERNGNDVTVTVRGQEGWCLAPPGHVDPEIRMEQRSGGRLWTHYDPTVTIEGGPYDCTGTFVRRQYHDFRVTFTVPMVIDGDADTFKVFFEWEGEPSHGYGVETGTMIVEE